MVSRVALIGLVILVVGLIVGIYGVYSPVSAQKASAITLLSTTKAVDANDYASQNIPLNQSQTIQITASIKNTTIFGFYIMNSAQYYNFYGCAPWCHTAANISGVGAVGPQNLTAQVNVTTITPSSPYSASFTAPAAGNYYLVLDNSVGPSWATYSGQNASVVACNTGNPFACDTVVDLSVTTQGTVTTHTANWTVVGIGIALLIIGGAVGTVMWGAMSGPRKPTPPTAAPVAKPTQ